MEKYDNKRQESVININTGTLISKLCWCVLPRVTRELGMLVFETTGCLFVHLWISVLELLHFKLLLSCSIHCLRCSVLVETKKSDFVHLWKLRDQ